MLLVPILYLLWLSHNKMEKLKKKDLSRLIKFMSSDGTFGPKSVEKGIQRGTLKNLTTPIRH